MGGINLDIVGLAVPYFAEYLGAWAMDGGYFSSFAALIDSADIERHLRDRVPVNGTDLTSYSVVDGVATIPIRGTMMKSQTSMGSGTSTVAARRAIRAAVADPAVTALVLDIESPGGTVSGTKELADEVAAAAKSKPVVAQITDIGASAAYWVASQADAIFANEMARVGSIGTYGVVVDSSAAAAASGIKVHVLRAGEFKGAGEPGTEIGPATLAHLQTQIEQLNEFFMKAVAGGRGFSPDAIATLATGKTWLASDGLANGLIDGVQTLEKTVADAAAANRKTEKRKMGATILELRAACPNAPDNFILGQLERGADVATAMGDYIAELQLSNETLTADLADADEHVASLAQRPGVPAVAETPVIATDAASARVRFNAAVADEMKAAPGILRAAALRRVVVGNPELHAELIAEANK